ncbi:MAG: PAS domain-containing protein, partial [Betaproteobacteria bacterium]
MTSTPADSPVEGGSLLEQLQLQNLELERQNQELRTAFDKVNALRERYADMYNFSPVGYFTLDSLGMILEINLAGAILLGIRRSEKGRQPFAAFISPKDRPAFTRFITQVLNGKGKKYCEVLLLASSHRPEATALIKGVADETGRECRIVVVDINAESAADELISKRALLNGIPSGVWLKDQHRRSLEVNWKLQDRLDYSYPHSLPSPADKAWPESPVRAYEPLIETGSSDKWHKWLETGKASVIADAGIVGMLNSRKILDGAEDAIFIADQWGRYQYLNQAALRLFGYSSEELLSMSI